jgi:hypothetical protein
MFTHNDEGNTKTGASENDIKIDLYENGREDVD